MRLITFGGGGNIGFWVEKEFLDKGHKVLSVSRGLKETKRQFQETTSSLSHLREDLKHPSISLRNEVNKANVIIDFVCFTQTDASFRKTLLSEFSGLYIMISTVAVYDRTHNLNTLSTSSTCNNLDWPYARNKYEAELATRSHTTSYEKKVLRLGHTFDTSLPVPFGPGDWTIPKWLLQGEPLLIHRDGESFWPLLHSIDVAKRIYLVASNPELFADTINVVANVTVSWAEIGLAFFRCLGLEPNFKYISIDELRTKHMYWSDSVKFHKGFDERYIGAEQDIFREYLSQDIDIDSGLRISFEWYLSNPVFRKINTTALLDLTSLKAGK